MGVHSSMRPEMGAQLAKTTITVSAEPVSKERGHGRGKTQVADKTDIGLRGVPVIGHGSGAISQTAPGGEIGAAARLERAGRELVRQRLHRNRFRAEREG